MFLRPSVASMQYFQRKIIRKMRFVGVCLDEKWTEFGFDSFEKYDMWKATVYFNEASYLHRNSIFSLQYNYAWAINVAAEHRTYIIWLSILCSFAGRMCGHRFFISSHRFFPLRKNQLQSFIFEAKCALRAYHVFERINHEINYSESCLLFRTLY